MKMHSNFKASTVFVIYIVEECCLLGYNNVLSVENKPMFRRNMSPAFSGSKSKPSKGFACYPLHAVFLFVFYIYPEDGCGIFLRNIG
jgi:hypothetical protein